jgi:hypothetical protein
MFPDKLNSVQFGAFELANRMVKIFLGKINSCPFPNVQQIVRGFVRGDSNEDFYADSYADSYL